MKKAFKHPFRLLIVLIALFFGSNYNTHAANGKYSERTISGATSTWDFGAATTGSSQKITSGTIDNGIYFVSSSLGNQQLASSGGLSNKATSEIYIPVVSANSAGTIEMTTYGTSDTRWLQLFIGTTEAANTKRLWSKYAATAGDGKKGPQSFDFTSSDLTQVDDIYYIQLRSNNTEMKVSTFKVTLTNGDKYEGGGTPTVSSDATLSDLKVDGKTVSGFAAATTTYSVTIPATQTTDPVVSATPNDVKAGVPVISQAKLPTPGQTTTATVVVTAEDGTTTQTYTINFTRAELSHDADLKDIQVNGQSISSFAAATLTYNVTVPFSTTTNTMVTATTSNTAAQAVVTGPNGVTGTATINVTAEDGTTTKTYTVNITKAAASSDANLKELKINGNDVPGFAAGTLTYTVELPYGTTAAPTVTASTNYAGAGKAITQADSPTGTATIVVTAEDSTQKTYTITFTVADKPAPPIVPPGYHSPGQYIWEKVDGGYGATFVNFNNAQYEVYYVNRDAVNSKLDISTDNADKGGYEVATGSDDKKFAASDGWLTGSTNGRGGETGFSAQDEFKQSIHSMKFQNNYTMTLKVCGYSEFAIVAKDNNADASKNKHLVVKIDGKEQTQTLNSSNFTIRRYAMTTEQHTIVVTGLSTSDSKVVAFSLKVGTTPAMPDPVIEKQYGKDTGQVVLQTMSVSPICYTVKYNQKTQLRWVGAEATGVGLTTLPGEKYDTITVSGPAMCPVGTYTYHLVTMKNTLPYDSVEGSFTVTSKITGTDSVFQNWVGQEIKTISYRYYALSEEDVTLTWHGTAPNGIEGRGKDGNYTISGICNTPGTYKYTISVAGGNSLNGQLVLRSFDPGKDPILYLYKGEDPLTSKDGIYAYLKSIGKNPFEMEQNGKLRGDYSLYTMIIISESCDANDGEVIAVARGEANRPVLNMKGFTYSVADDRLSWGNPDNGSITNKQLTVVQDSHPIFKALGWKNGDKKTLLDSVAVRGLMPIDITLENSVALATAPTRARDYNKDSVAQTILHEIPAEMRGGQKYLCLPIGSQSCRYLTADGEKLLGACVNYLLGQEPGIKLPELKITSFSLRVGDRNYVGEIDQEKNEIIVTVDSTRDHLEDAVPTIQLADPTTFVTPASGSTIDASKTYFGVDFVVSDHINKRYYNLRVILPDPDPKPEPEGLNDVLEEDGWISIYDIRGRKIMTTNESLHQLSLDRGMYIVVTSRGSYKIFK